jgi:hypothetical protein
MPSRRILLPGGDYVEDDEAMFALPSLLNALGEWAGD